MIIDWFDTGAAHHADRPCIEDGRTTVSYREALAATRRIARALHSAIGDRGHAGLYSPNCTQALLAALGTFRAGTPYVPLNARDSVDDNAWFLDFAECDLLFLHSSFARHLPRLRELAPRLREFVCLDRDLPDALSLERWSAGQPDTPFEVPRGPDDVGDHQVDRRHHRASQRRTADTSRAGSNVPGHRALHAAADAPGAPRRRAVHACRGRHRLSFDGAGRAPDPHGAGRPGPDSAAYREPARELSFPAADGDLPSARSSGAASARLLFARVLHIRRRADVGRQAARGDRSLRPGDGAVLRAG